MPAGNAPQYRGVDAVIDAYMNAGIPAYAVCYAKDINLRYVGDDMEEGAELLKCWLDKIKDFGSQAIYQMRLYEDLNGKSIKSNTAYDMAFKFVLNDRDTNYLPVKAESAITNAELINILKENAELKAENAVLSLKVDQYEQDDQDDEPEKIAAIVKPIGEQLLEKFAPTLGAIGQAIGDRIVDFITPATAKVSGIVLDTGNIDEEKLIEQSIRRLKNKIPDVPGVAHVLMKLADLAEKSPSEFNMYMGILMKRNF